MMPLRSGRSQTSIAPACAKYSLRRVTVRCPTVRSHMTKGSFARPMDSSKQSCADLHLLGGASMAWLAALHMPQRNFPATRQHSLNTDNSSHQHRRICSTRCWSIRSSRWLGAQACDRVSPSSKWIWHQKLKLGKSKTSRGSLRRKDGSRSRLKVCQLATGQIALLTSESIVMVDLIKVPERTPPLLCQHPRAAVTPAQRNQLICLHRPCRCRDEAPGHWRTEDGSGDQELAIVRQVKGIAQR
mmetsp:Transcript_18117/g.31766  ORF Transcript_18117/g.31766 Transcript_18117/m.31766 type:complete len:243 (+) Transcript_18117:256-984(+)